MERMLEEEQGGYWAFPLANGEVAEKGKLACVDTANSGVIVSGKTATGLVSLGVFHESFTGNGTKKIQIKLHHELQATWWDNDATVAVGAGDRGKLCYIKDAVTVSGDSTGRSVAGLVLDVSPSQGVLVVFGFKTF
jgi:hypothetical protein